MDAPQAARMRLLCSAQFIVLGFFQTPMVRWVSQKEMMHVASLLYLLQTSIQTTYSTMAIVSDNN